MEIKTSETNWNALWDQGMNLIEARTWDEAEIVFIQIIHIWPEDSQAYFHLSYIYSEQKRYEDALLCLQKTLDLKEKLPEAHLMIGIALNDLERYDEAANQLQATLQLYPWKEGIQVHLGYALFSLERWEESISHLEAAMKSGSQDPSSINNLGSAYRKIGNFQDAIRCHRKAIDLDPSSSNAWMHLGLDHRDMKRERKALSCFEKAIELDPESAGATYHLAATLFRLRRFDAALPLYIKAMRLNPEYGEGWYWLGELYRTQRKYDDACDSYRRAIQFMPDHAWARFQLGNCALKLGEWGEANEQHLALHHLNPELAEHLNDDLEEPDLNLQNQFILFSSLTCFSLWCICWRLDHWKAWVVGSVFLHFGIILLEGYFGRINERFYWTIPKYIRTIFPYAIGGFWLGAIGAPSISLAGLGLAIGLDMLFKLCRGFRWKDLSSQQKINLLLSTILMPGIVTALTAYALGYGIMFR